MKHHHTRSHVASTSLSFKDRSNIDASSDEVTRTRFGYANPSGTTLRRKAFYRETENENQKDAGSVGWVGMWYKIGVRAWTRGCACMYDGMVIVELAMW